MTETQLLTIAIAVAAPFLGVLIGVLINNSRLNDVKELLSAKVETRAAAKDVYEIRNLIEKNHSEMLVRMSDIDTRLARLENERRVVNG